MKEVQPGTTTELEVIEREGSRWILEGDVRMNASDADEAIQEGDRVTVFLYVNRRKELSATMQLPHVTIGSYGWARVIRVDAKEGVYVDIGAPVEVLVNKADMPRIRALWPQTDDMLYMTLRTDLGGNLFGRLVTEERVLELIAEAPSDVTNANLKARAYRLLPVGSFLLSIPENYRIFIHNTEMEKEPRLGEELEVRVIGVRDDGTLNGSLLPRKQERLADDSEVILRYLQDSGGQMPFTDKSTPDEIQEMFAMSKGSFKRALGRLMKEGKITQEDGWTRLK
ncbi:S1-like domain-containing RNA-binding protein [Sporosarcina sp. 179-K 3D1 HS]|uniref:CvfB family protein n=1 Tax=Sporosarcina sp. 179-K 3D1 HS TaxID=3232169 RepID=UPI0039A1BAE2